MALDCGHRTAPGSTVQDKIVRLAEGFCPVCPGERTTEGQSPAKTVTYYECSCCGCKWTGVVNGHLRQYMQF